MKTYKFAVSLCGGYCGGSLEVKAEDEEKAYEKAMNCVANRLVKAFPTLDIEYNVECDTPDDEECLEICPVCGADIEPKDSEDNGYGELHLYWKCNACGGSGKAVIDQQNNNAFVGHEVD